MRIGIVQLFAAVLSFHFLLGCARHEAPLGHWDDETATFAIPEEKISYTLPTDKSFWGIAVEESLPESMLFFGLDTQTQTCIGVFKAAPPAIGLLKAKYYTDKELETMIWDVAKPNVEQTIVSENLEKERTIFLDSEAWAYRLCREVIAPASTDDTIAVYYSGYVFDAKKNPFGIVVISADNPLDSIGIQNKYTKALKRLE